MEKEYHDKQELTMADLGLSLEELRYQPLELFAREGAKHVEVRQGESRYQGGHFTDRYS